MHAGKETPAPISLAHAADEPLVFYGPPERLAGTLRLRNRTADKAKLAALALDLPGLVGAAGEPVREVPLSIRLYPGEQVETPVALAMDSRTPPGTYEGKLTVNGASRALVCHVIQNLDLRVHPEVVRLFTEGQREFESRFVAENAGNVPIRLGVRCKAPLIDSMESRAALRQGLAEACAEGDRGDALRALLGALSDQQVGLVEFVRPDVTLKPGEVYTGTATVVLPEDLRSFRRYTADVELYNAKGLLEVYTGDLKKEPVVRGRRGTGKPSGQRNAPPRGSAATTRGPQKKARKKKG